MLLSLEDDDDALDRVFCEIIRDLIRTAITDSNL